MFTLYTEKDLYNSINKQLTEENPTNIYKYENNEITISISTKTYRVFKLIFHEEVMISFGDRETSKDAVTAIYTKYQSIYNGLPNYKIRLETLKEKAVSIKCLNVSDQILMKIKRLLNRNRIIIKKIEQDTLLEGDRPDPTKSSPKK
ncbi:MAG: hypothetical protein K0S74_643 [Chlamydiales bacterium]|nr:hypothetical protein [Chlamydiales bacterium]